MTLLEMVLLIFLIVLIVMIQLVESKVEDKRAQEKCYEYFGNKKCKTGIDKLCNKCPYKNNIREGE